MYIDANPSKSDAASESLIDRLNQELQQGRSCFADGRSALALKHFKKVKLCFQLLFSDQLELSSNTQLRIIYDDINSAIQQLS